jgi:hypothetical protein
MGTMKPAVPKIVISFIIFPFIKYDYDIEIKQSLYTPWRSLGG